MNDHILIPSRECFDLIKRFEGCAKRLPDGRFAAYPDPGTGKQPYTIGWGSTGPDIHLGDVWTQEQCDARLMLDVCRFADGVERLLKGFDTTQHQFDAMVCFAYNVGLKNFENSTLLKLHMAKDYGDAAEQFGRWNKAAGHVMAGLTRRRQAEADLYRKVA